MTSYKPVAAALRVLEVLASVNRLCGRATIGEVHHRTGIDKATIVRMLETLTHAGYVVRDPKERLYRTTGRTLMLSAGFDRHSAVGAIVATHLGDFRQTIDWPSDVALFDHDAMLIIESSRRGGALSFNRAPGYRAPVLGTSLGLAYIAHCPQSECDEFVQLAAKDPAPWNDIARDPALMEATLASIRERGYATMTDSYSRREYMNRIFSIGVPIISESTVYAAINVIYLRNVLTPEVVLETLLAPLKGVAEQMARDLASRFCKKPAGLQLKHNRK